MAENINIDFMPNRRTSDIQRVTTVEDYLKLLTDRTKFCFTSVYDDFADMGKRIEYLENYSLAMPSSVDLTVENAVILQEKESQQAIHNYTKVHYVDGNSVGYGDTANSIICGGYLLAPYENSSHEPSMEDGLYPEMKFPLVAFDMDDEPYTDYSISVNLAVTDEQFGKSYSYVETYTNFNGEKVTREVDTINRVQGQAYILPHWAQIRKADDRYPYGFVEVKFRMVWVEDEVIYHSTIGSFLTTRYFPFASEAEYNAAVGLTNTPLELLKLQDFQYLVPESQIIVDKALSPDSDNVIANSAVAKALAEKADKGTVETLSLVVDSKADIIELEALAEIVNEKAESSDLTAHADGKDNPHNVTKEQIGLSNVEDKSSSDILSELQIGGTQILRNTQTTTLGSVSAPALWSEGAWRKASGTNGTWESVDVTNCPEPYIEKGWKITSVGENTSAIQLITITQDAIPLAIGEEYILSCYARGKGTLMQSTGGTPITVKYTAIDNAEWARYELPFVAQGTAEHSVYFGVRYQGDSIEVCGMKLEIGNKATSWNICPKDIANHEERIAALEATILSLGGET